MDLFTIDDSEQRKPSRDGMGPLVAVGGVHVPGSKVRELEVALDQLCKDTGFPAGHEFKWSPEPGMWMRKALVETARETFFLQALAIAHAAGVKAIVALEDTSRGKADHQSPTPEDDVTMLFLERAQADLGFGEHGLVVFDRPGGDRQAEFHFLERCIDRIRIGTAYTKLDKLALALATDSKHSRLIQLADLVTSCSTSFVAGEPKWSPSVFTNGILPMLRSDYGCRGGRGLKIQPDMRYANLYHWLLGDEGYVRYQQWECELPSRRFTAYRETPDVA